MSNKGLAIFGTIVLVVSLVVNIGALAVTKSGYWSLILLIPTFVFMWLAISHLFRCH
jgi:hypothetical protein